MIPVINKAKLYSRDIYIRRNYAHYYLSDWIGQSAKDFDGVANKLSKEYLYKINELLEAYKQVLCFYDVLLEYTFSNKDDNTKYYYLPAIKTTYNSIRNQKKHVFSVKNAIRNTCLNKDLAYILDEYIKDIYKRISYLEEVIIPAQVKITPLAAFYMYCKDNGADFVNEMKKYIITDEIDVYTGSEPKPNVDFDVINQTKNKNAEELVKIINNFNKNLEKENKVKYDEYMQEYFDNIEKIDKEKENKRTIQKAAKELKKYNIEKENRQRIESAKSSIEIEEVLLDKAIKDECSKLQENIDDVIHTNTLLKKISDGLSCDNNYLILHARTDGKASYVKDFKYRSDGRVIFKTTTNPSDASLYNKEETDKYISMFTDSKSALMYKVLDLRIYKKNINEYFKTRENIVAEVSKQKTKEWVEEEHIITSDVVVNIKRKNQVNRPLIGVYYFKNGSYDSGIKFIHGTSKTINNGLIQGTTSLSYAYFFTKEEITTIKKNNPEYVKEKGLIFVDINTLALHTTKVV